MSSKLQRVYRLSLLTCMLIGGLVLSESAEAAVSSDELKAVYLYRIANFIYWNEPPLEPNLLFCVVDNSNIFRALEQVATTVTSIRLDSKASEQCDIAYFDNEADFSNLTDRTVTIGSHGVFLQQGGAIALPLKNGAIRPKVNLDNLGDYTISSQLLRISDIEGGRK
ncbi:YfiR family protein [Vibrio agarivorans]|uniref:YfiR family protein n=1 Tax=Vibrio agarivorans TaxID=153622 RepID=A0ABT7Y5A7_9VIBR|nr:YfiR family protein [Vibrio agarivorans]MDN2483235.1 YfiR family protein [Vibrio agarivorans]